MAGAGEADFKSNVLLRDEKGFFGIPLKRLIVAGMTGGGFYSIGKLFIGELALPFTLVIFILTIVMTSQKGGLPRWERLLLRVRGSLIISMIDHPDSLAAQIGKFFELKAENVALDGEQIFTAVEDNTGSDELVDFSDWTLYADARAAKANDGLVIVERPKAHLPPKSAAPALGSGKA